MRCVICKTKREVTTPTKEFFLVGYNVKNRCVCGHPKSIHAWFFGQCKHVGCDCEEYEEDR